MSEPGFQHYGAAGKRTSHGVSLARTADDDGRLHSGSRCTIQFHFRSELGGIPPVRCQSSVAGVFIRSVAHVAALLLARTE